MKLLTLIIFLIPAFCMTEGIYTCKLPEGKKYTIEQKTIWGFDFEEANHLFYIEQECLEGEVLSGLYNNLKIQNDLADDIISSSQKNTIEIQAKIADLRVDLAIFNDKNKSALRDLEHENIRLKKYILYGIGVISMMFAADIGLKYLK